jgi:putative peptide maturation dehydrogenase
VLLDDPDPEHVALRELDERLGKQAWNPYAALFHALSSRRGIDIGLPEQEPEAAEAMVAEVFEKFVDRHGPPPPHFQSPPNVLSRRELPLQERDGQLYEALAMRRTTRVFDTAPIGEEDVGALLYYAFGCHGTLTVHNDIVALHKTSPSGGGLHAVEVYPLVIDVDGLEPGLYHYGVERHDLELLEPVGRDEARRLAVAFTCGQTYFGDASALFFLSARFYRSYWKYRNQPRAYSVLLMDAAHMSQTFYLVCADLGLGAFVTAAVNNGDVDDRLGLDGFTEGTLIACGCGIPAQRASALQPRFEPYVPRGNRAG